MTDADLDDDTLGHLLTVATEAVDRAAAILRTSGPDGLRLKGDRDMATDVDFKVERDLREFLAAATPDLGFLGEEEGRTDVGEGTPYWVLDPVDGTANFAHGLPLCAVSLGLVVSDNSVLGVIDLPLLRERFQAARGRGATLNGSPITIRQETRIEHAIVAMGDYAVGPEAGPRNVSRLELASQLAGSAQRVRMFGAAAVDLAWVAAGRLDASVMFSNKPWDTTAGVLIAREAGAVVLDVDGSPHTVTSAGTVATSPALADQIIDIVRRTRAAG